MLEGSVLVLVALAVAGGWGLWRWRCGTKPSRLALALTMGGYAFLLLGVLYFPLVVDPVLRRELITNPAPSAYRLNVIPFRTVGELLDRESPTQAVRQIGGNILLLVPLGILAPALWPRLRRLSELLGFACAFALGVEGLQYLARLARISMRSIDIDDVILYIAGVVVGFVVWLALTFLRRSMSSAR